MRIILFLFCVAVVVSCGSAATPEDTVASYLQAVDQFEFDKARTFLVENDSLVKWQKNVEAAADMIAKSDRPAYIKEFGNRKYAIVITDNKPDRVSATAVAQGTQIATPIFFALTKHGDQWKIENVSFFEGVR